MLPLEVVAYLKDKDLNVLEFAVEKHANQDISFTMLEDYSFIARISNGIVFVGISRCV